AIVGAWLWLRERMLAAGPGPIDVGADVLGPAATVVGTFAFAVNGGSAIVAGMLARVRPTDGEPKEDDGPPAGRLIGILERLVLLPLVWTGQWGALGLVLTAKSIARFKALEERAFAEVYLVGTL